MTLLVLNSELQKRYKKHAFSIIICYKLYINVE